MEEDPDHTAATSPPTRGATAQDQTISLLEASSSRRQAKSAPTTPKKSQRTVASQIPIEDVPNLKASLERLKTKKMPDVNQRNLRTTTSASSVRGHQFTVGNFSNGLIYLRSDMLSTSLPALSFQLIFFCDCLCLAASQCGNVQKNLTDKIQLDRPVVRPTHEKFTPLRSSDQRAESSREDDYRPRKPELKRTREKRHSTTSPPRTPTRQTHNKDGVDFYIKSSPPVRTRSNHNRAYSFSTATGRSTPTAPDLESYRIVIDRVESQRPKTAGPEPSFDGLQVKIPHYALGSPRFTPHGTPFLQGSMSNQGSSSLDVPSTKGEPGSTTGSQITDFKWFTPGDERSKLSSSPIPLLPDRENSPFASPPPSMPSPIRHIPTPTAITPQIFDVLSFPPFSELPSVVKYDPRNQQILAATPPRLIAQITSATFLDYQLLSDFFLTYRLFMTPVDLVAYLIARLRWAIARKDDIGRVVRVRTFVAIRHWLLNYFGDDFVPSLTLRQKFVASLNEFSQSVLLAGSQSDIKIIGELKRCWRRTCALYWDDGSNNQIANATVEQEIHPGGPPGERNQNDRIGQGFPVQSSRTRPNANLPQLHQKYPNYSRSSDLNGSDKNHQSGDSRTMNKKFSIKNLDKKVLAKAASDASIHLTSQAPMKLPKKPASAAYLLPGFTGTNSSMRAGPSTNNNETFTSTKRSRPSTHKRSGSFSDALRDNRQPLPLQNSLARSTHVLMAFPYAGSSLVRGTLLPPTAAYVEMIAPSTPTPEAGMYILNNTSMTSSSTGINEQYESTSNHHRLGLGGPGMKKFIESLKKVLSGKGHPNIYNTSGIHSPVPSSKHDNDCNDSEFTSDSLTRYVAANYIRNSVSSGSRTSGRAWTNSMDGRMARIDLLGAGVVDAFQRVMQEEGMSEEKNNRRNERSRSTRSRPILRRATVDTTTFGESALSEFDEKSVVVENFPLSPQTRRRGNTMRGLATTAPTKAAKELQGGATTVYQSPLANINIEDFGFLSLDSSAQDQSIELTHVTSNYEQESSQPQREEGYLNDKVLGRVSADSFLSAIGKSKPRRHSYNSYTSLADEFSDAASIFGSSEDVAKAIPNRLLRRRPGGDLRAAATVTDLGVSPRPKSTGSISAFSTSTSVYSTNVVRASVMTFGNARNEYTPRPQQLAAGVVSLGAVAKGGGVQFPADDHPALPPPDSPTTAMGLFEQGVMQLAALGDNESDDGGIEVALMKLEGRYDRRMSKSPQTIGALAYDEGAEQRQSGVDIDKGSSFHQPGVDTKHFNPSVVAGMGSPPVMQLDNEEEPQADHLARSQRRHKKVIDQVPLETPPAVNSSATSFGFPLAAEAADEVTPIIRQFRFPETKENRKGSVQHPPRSSSVLKAKPSNLPVARKHISFQGLGSEAQPIRQSVAEEDMDYMSELSSELSSEMPSRGHSLNHTSAYKFSKSNIMTDLGISSHPLRHPPSPPLTLEQALGTNPENFNGFYQQRLSTSEHDAFPWTSIHNISSPDSTPRQRAKIRDSISLLQPPSIHLPFILAYDSELLAKQFTLIEKDALNEIDWKELVELRWKQTSTSVRDWVEFLKSKDVRGVELIIARFNLVRNHVYNFPLSII